MPNSGHNLLPPANRCSSNGGPPGNWSYWDDIHLADRHSQMLLSYLARRIQDTGIVMIVSVPNPIPRIAQDLDDLFHNPVSSRVSVTPLDHAALQHLAHDMGIYGLDSTAVTA